MAGTTKTDEGLRIPLQRFWWPAHLYQVAFVLVLLLFYYPPAANAGALTIWGKQAGLGALLIALSVGIRLFWAIFGRDVRILESGFVSGGVLYEWEDVSKVEIENAIRFIFENRRQHQSDQQTFSWKSLGAVLKKPMSSVDGDYIVDLPAIPDITRPVLQKLVKKRPDLLGMEQLKRLEMMQNRSRQQSCYFQAAALVLVLLLAFIWETWMLMLVPACGYFVIPPGNTNRTANLLQAIGALFCLPTIFGVWGMLSLFASAVDIKLGLAVATVFSVLPLLWIFAGSWKTSRSLRFLLVAFVGMIALISLWMVPRSMPDYIQEPVVGNATSRQGTVVVETGGSRYLFHNGEKTPFSASGTILSVSDRFLLIRRNVAGKKELILSSLQNGKERLLASSEVLYMNLGNFHSDLSGIWLEGSCADMEEKQVLAPSDPAFLTPDRRRSCKLVLASFDGRDVQRYSLPGMDPDIDRILSETEQFVSLRQEHGKFWIFGDVSESKREGSHFFSCVLELKQGKLIPTQRIFRYSRSYRTMLSPVHVLQKQQILNLNTNKEVDVSGLQFDHVGGTPLFRGRGGIWLFDPSDDTLRELCKMPEGAAIEAMSPSKQFLLYSRFHSALAREIGIVDTKTGTEEIINTFGLAFLDWHFVGENVILSNHLVPYPELTEYKSEATWALMRNPHCAGKQ